MFANFFTQIFSTPQGNVAQMQQKRQGVHPESPHRPQQRGKDCEKQDAAAQGTQAEIQPQLALGPVEGEQKDRPADRHAVEDVQRRRQPGELQAEGPQQVIQQPQKRSQQSSAQKCRRLGGNFNLHQPNRRLKNPPRL